MATSAEQLILRGLHLVLSSTFAPNDPVKQAAHYARLTQDIGPWMADYVTEMAKPAVDFTLTPIDPAPSRDRQGDPYVLPASASHGER